MAKLVKLAAHRFSDAVVEPEFDPIFFPKESITPGRLLVCYGRRDPLSTWNVWRIETYTKLPSGLHRLERTTQVMHLSDLVYLERVGESDGTVAKRRRTSFSCLSYSAIWRLKL